MTRGLASKVHATPSCSRSLASRSAFLPSHPSRTIHMSVQSSETVVVPDMDVPFLRSASGSFSAGALSADILLCLNINGINVRR